MADTLSARPEVPLPAGISTNYAQGGMTYLGLVARLRQECGVTGSPPTSVVSLTGEMKRLADYINQSWMDIQNMHTDWEFMKQPVSFITREGKQAYSAIDMQVASFGNYKLDSFTLYTPDDPSDERILPFLEYDCFKDMFMFGSRRASTNRPLYFTLNSQKDFLLGETPDGQYQVAGEGWAMPTLMVNDTDRPCMPGQYHMAIVYGAMLLYGQYEAAPEVFGHGEMQYSRMMARLANEQLPQMCFGGAPLA